MKNAVSVAMTSLTFLIAANAFAGQRSLGDLTPGSADSFNYQQESSMQVAYLNGHTFFTTAGCKLWKTDGTAATTVLAADLSNGDTACSGGNFLGLLRVNNKIVIARSTSPTVVISDGTQAGTSSLNLPNSTTVRVYPWVSNPGYVLLVTGTVATPTSEVWATDGTVGNTFQLAQLAKGSVVLASMSRGRLAIGGNDGLWLAEDAGTPATQIGSGFTDVGSGVYLISSGDSLYFTATDAAHGKELWFSDLTSAGTHIIQDFTPGPNGSNISLDKVDNAGLAYFKIGDVLWRTDGTSANTFAVTVPGQVITNLPVQVVGDSVIFDGLENDGHHLRKSDGTLAGTTEYSANLGSNFCTGPASRFW